MNMVIVFTLKELLFIGAVMLWAVIVLIWLYYSYVNEVISMLEITYVENGVRNTRKCDEIAGDSEGLHLIYNDVPNDFGEKQCRVNTLAIGTDIENVVEV